MNSNRYGLLALIIVGSIVGLAGTDLVLPAIPKLHENLHGSLSLAQLVLASFTAGTGLGLLTFGELGGKFSQYRLMLCGLLFYSLLSLIATWPSTMTELVIIRFFKGLRPRR